MVHCSHYRGTLWQGGFDVLERTRLEWELGMGEMKMIGRSQHAMLSMSELSQPSRFIKFLPLYGFMNDQGGPNNIPSMPKKHGQNKIKLKLLIVAFITFSCLFWTLLCCKNTLAGRFTLIPSSLFCPQHSQVCQQLTIVICQL